MAKNEKNYRLGIDLGSTSLGWCMLELDQDNSPKGIINMGVRIFPDGREMKSHEPLSVKRRGYRGQRRNLDRYLLRVRGLISYLLENGFLPEDQRKRDDVFKKNPYELRARALDEKLEPAEFARALIHLAKRRGFRSNRKVLSDKETKISEAISNLREALQKEKARTLGEYLWNLYNETPGHKAHLRKPIKFRYEKIYENPIFPTRDMVENEFDTIWDAQSQFDPALTSDHKEKIRKIIFSQRPLKPTQKGKCELEPDEERSPKASPLFQEFRLLQALNHMKLVDVFANETMPLTADQYQTLYDHLSAKESATFEGLRKLLFGKKYNDYRINLEISEDRKLPGNETRHALLKTKNEALIAYWESLDMEKQNSIVEIVISDLDDEPALNELSELGVPDEFAPLLLEVKFKDGYCSLSLKAMRGVIPFLRQGQVFSEACKSAGYDHSLEYNGEVFTSGDLPYYGEVLRRETIALARRSGDEDADENGKINNPTVHVALNQLRKLVNALALRYGPPAEIVLELAKEARMSKQQRDELNREIGKNTKLNNEIKEFLLEHGQAINHENMLRVKLWQELGDDPLDRTCVYSGNKISVTDLFSRAVEIDHILPFSRTYDDTNANKLLCTHAANQAKGNRTPYEAFKDGPDGYDWQDIIVRAKHLRKSKQRRFLSDAMQRFEQEGDLIGRMLNDTRYMSRVAMKYMWYVCGNSSVWTVKGNHTALLRSKWGLNTALGETDYKERSDHRHHAIDAFVIALTTRSLLKHLVERMAATQNRTVSELAPPWPGFDHAEFRRRVNSILVSYKPDQISPDKLSKRNQTGGALVKETAYYLLKDPITGSPVMDEKKPGHLLYTFRKKVKDFSEDDVEHIVKKDLKKEIELATQGLKGKEFKEKLLEWAVKPRKSPTGKHMPSVSKIKIAESKSIDSMIPVFDKNGRAFKYMSSGENLFADIYMPNPADPYSKWAIKIVNSYKAHQPGFVPQWKKDHPKGKKIMRVYKNDVIALDGENGERELRRVKKMDKAKGILYLRELNVAKKEKNKEDIGEQFSPRQLMEKRAMKAGIDIMGRVFDPIVNEK